ncbi:MAG: tetratricopeptide repeat protein, partial [Acidobacteriota bacterium]|nr:tetratricopeptide repeat protein [Acidobacteriota bacterium]
MAASYPATATHVLMDANRLIAAGLLACLLAADGAAQSSGTTVRHRREAAVEPAATALVREAEAALDKHDYVTAEAKLKAATVASPQDYQAWFYLGYVYGQTQKPAAAIEAYRRSVAAKADVFESNLNLGLLLARTNDPDAGKYLRAATQLKPTAKVEEGRARAWLSLARVLEASHPEDAVAAYGEAAKLRPKDPEPHLSAAVVFEKQKKYRDAETEFRQALALDPKSSEALAGLVNVSTEQKDFAGAEAMLRKYLDANPGDAAARVQFGRLLAAQKKYPEATTEFEAGLAATPDDPSLARELAAVYTVGGKWEKAAPLYEKLVQQQPRDAELRRVYGIALMHQRRYREAQQQLLAAINADPK